MCCIKLTIRKASTEYIINEIFEINFGITNLQDLTPLTLTPFSIISLQHYLFTHRKYEKCFRKTNKKKRFLGSPLKLKKQANKTPPVKMYLMKHISYFLIYIYLNTTLIHPCFRAIM